LKILFVCSCLEPGSDGVGDYTRRLAGELRGRGHGCSLLSLADPYVKKVTAADFDSATGAISCLRLAATDSWRNRVRQAISFREFVAPDWISWQIVPYGFDPRGLCFGLGARCREISGGCRSQIMFHEIWIGEAEQASFKNRVVGQLQKLIIKDLLVKLDPRVVRTHTPLYCHLLEKLGARAGILPLFGNVRLTAHPDPAWLTKKWPPDAIPFDAPDRTSWWIFVVFGSIHPEWDAGRFLQQASGAAHRVGKKCLLISIGRAGAFGERMWRELQKRENESWRLLPLGPQPEEEISQCLLAADFGVSPVPPENVFKSGTSAAMIEHGLQIILTRSVSRYRDCPPEILTAGMRNVVTPFDASCDLENLRKTKIGSLLPAIAGQFVDDLQQA
jgi:hypothetical protein